MLVLLLLRYSDTAGYYQNSVVPNTSKNNLGTTKVKQPQRAVTLPLELLSITPTSGKQIYVSEH